MSYVGHVPGNVCVYGTLVTLCTCLYTLMIDEK